MPDLYNDWRRYERRHLCLALVVLLLSVQPVRPSGLVSTEPLVQPLSFLDVRMNFCNSQLFQRNIQELRGNVLMSEREF